MNYIPILEHPPLYIHIRSQQTKWIYIELFDQLVSAVCSGLSLHDFNTSKPTEFTLTDKLKQGIKQAQVNHQKVMDSVGMHLMKYDSLDKRKCKKYGLSPDSIMQLGFQLAYKKQNNRYVGTYESCSTSAFRYSSSLFDSMFRF